MADSGRPAPLVDDDSDASPPPTSAAGQQAASAPPPAADRSVHFLYSGSDSPITPAEAHYTVSSPVAHSLRRNSLAAIAAQQAAHHNQAEFSLASERSQRRDDDDDDGSSSESDSDDDDTGALLRQSRARAASRSEIAKQYTRDVSPPRSARNNCDLPTIFNSTEEDRAYAMSEEPELGEWQLRAAAAVVRHRQSSTKVYNNRTCSLSFRDKNMEKAFAFYFASLNEHKLRRRLLLLNFLYMIYVTVEWGTRTSKHYSRKQQSWIIALRVFYIVVNAVVFTLSFVRREIYRRNINLWGTMLAVLTSTLIIIEGHLLRNIYSPWVLIILLMYMLGSNIYVRTMFSVSCAVCWYNMLLYNFVCLAFNPSGDLTTLHSTNAALLQLFFYDLILIFFILMIMVQTRKVEKQNRYAFLQYYVEVEQEEKERAEQDELDRANGFGPRGGKKKKKKSRKSDAGAGSERASGRAQSVDEAKTSGGFASDLNPHEQASPEPRPTATTSGGLTQRHLLPRNKDEELALLRELNAAEQQEDPFYLSAVMSRLLPVQQVTTSVHDDGGESGDRPATPPPGSVTSRRADGSLVTTTTETVYSNDPLAATLSQMRAKGITSMSEFIRHLKHQSKVREASEKIRDLPCMCCSNELPPWFTSYPFVLSAYRTNYTAKQCARSIFQWHNETINIWTEFIPCIIFILGIIIVESADPVVFSAKVSGWDRFFVLIGLLGGVVIRPLASGLAHTFYPMSNRAFIIWWSIDYVSILLSIMGYALVMGRFTFYCMISQQIFFYISVLVLFLSTIAAVLFVASAGIRTSSFLLYVLFANGLPYIYQLVLTTADLDDQHDVPKSYLVLWTLMWCLMLIGLLIKSSMIPERWWPGRFDIIGASHQWWHLFVNAGAACAYFTWKSYLLWRPTAKCEESYGIG